MAPRLLTHCTAILPDRTLPGAEVLIENGRIAAVEPAGAILVSTDCERLHCGDRLVAPGFVDPHCHGDGTTRFFDDPIGVTAALWAAGTTTVLPTLGYPDMRRGEIAHQVRALERALDAERARRSIPGVHLEGPYVNRRYGAQTNRGVIKDVERSEYEELLGLRSLPVRWWTCAPELEGAREFVTAAASHGIVVGAGHTEATPEEMSAAESWGLRVVTHWSNATGNPRPPAYAGTRSPGIDEAALVSDGLWAEVIPDRDGCHVHPVMLKLLYRAKGADRIVLITDAGYRRPDDPEIARDRDVSIDANGQLAGSRLTMARAAANFRAITGCSWPELFRMAALNAAKLLGLDSELGSLMPGRRANLVIFEKPMSPWATLLDGEIVWGAERIGQREFGQPHSA